MSTSKNILLTEKEKYGFTVGEIVTTRVQLICEDKKVHPAGSQIKIVAITPKVCYTSKSLIERNPELYDSKSYFYNAVVYGQDNDYKGRIRECFCTIKKNK